MPDKMKLLDELMKGVDVFCHENEIDFVFVAAAKDKSFSIKMVRDGSKIIFDKVSEVLKALKINTQ
jgi:FlaG/FlaF family flagellin (archaellin)